jgi:3-deoxy-manno-octulosonate cytidylyltransferase (CMP-KDO synthetase)
MPNSRVVAVIPARFESTRFPGKPLAPIAGKPMILWVIERARAASTVDEVFIATDDQRIYDAVIASGAKAVMTSREARSGTDRIAEAVARMDIEAVVDIQGDEPLINPDTIDAAVRALLDDPQCAVSTSCVELRMRAEFESPHNVKVVFAPDGAALYFSRSPIPSPARRPPAELADGQLLGHKHQGLYVFRKSALMAYSKMPSGRLEEIEKLEQLRFLENGYRINVVVTPHDSPGVDTPEDVPDVERRLMAMIS